MAGSTTRSRLPESSGEERHGTQDVLVARCEAADQAGLDRLKAELAAQLEASGLDVVDLDLA